MYILFKNKKEFFNKQIKIQFQLGLTKLTPKLNLTLAPLGINTTQLIQEFNKLNYNLLDESYILNCVFLYNLNTNFYNLVVKYYLFKQLFNYFNLIFDNKEEIIFFLSFLKNQYNNNFFYNQQKKINIDNYLIFFYPNIFNILKISKQKYNQLKSFN